jgi:hypothetical protein
VGGIKRSMPTLTLFMYSLSTLARYFFSTLHCVINYAIKYSSKSARNKKEAQVLFFSSRVYKSTKYLIFFLPVPQKPACLVAFDFYTTMALNSNNLEFTALFLCNLIARKYNEAFLKICNSYIPKIRTQY